MSDLKFTSAAILGSGSFGMAMAKLVAPKLDSVVLIGRDRVLARLDRLIAFLSQPR